ncbi:SGNH/GDSL hydrolase family protein [Nocardioides gilvus]|uniref:SGNH/GDSL hydrolase family protein n=1 Tax=Nocardioides gilvus TaxID=1735589 RepID=UPI000D74950E|nr:SGNH/GDSL hydrolase family protein [Nocardioides gilvus]
MPSSSPYAEAALRRAVAALVSGGALLAVARVTLAHQASIARRVIGRPIGDEAPDADGLYKKNSGRTIDLLLLGDSIAAGLGAEDAGHTLGGQLARRLARATGRTVRLRTVAVVGAETSMLSAQTASLPPGYRPDVSVVVVGGNDVTHRVRLSDSRAELTLAIEALQALGSTVVVGTCPDLGALRALPQPLRTVAGLLSRQLASAQREVALSLGARAVTLADVVGPFFLTRPDEMFAVDRFHPSGAGYRRTAKAILPSVLAGLGHAQEVPFGHHAPFARLVTDPGDA